MCSVRLIVSAKKLMKTPPNRRKSSNDWKRRNRARCSAYRKEWMRANPTKRRQYYVSSGERERQNQLQKTMKGRARTMFKGARTRAREKGLDFTISKEWIVEKLKSGKCSATGIPFDFTSSRGPFVPSIDRINPKKGYTKRNSRIVSLIYNAAKREFKDADVQLMAKALMRRVQHGRRP